MKWYDKQKRLTLNKISKVEEDESDKKLHELEDIISNDQDSISLEDAIALHASQENLVEPPVVERTVEKTIIGKGTHIKGDLETDGDLFISGNLLGNIICLGHLELNGDIQGDIICGSGKFMTTTINGNIDCKNDLTMERNTNIKGNVNATSLSMSGSVIGNIKVTNSLQLMSKSRILGDVEAQYMESEKGSSINGKCSILLNDEGSSYTYD